MDDRKIELAIVKDDMGKNFNEEMENVFRDLAKIELGDRIGHKNGLSYLSWANAYEEMMKYDPHATFKIFTQAATEKGDERFWFDDGKTAWVQTAVTIKGRTIKSFPLPIMDFKNQAIPAENVKTTDANKSVMRCLVKNIALFGLGIYIFQGEDLPEDARNFNALLEEVIELAKNKMKAGGEIAEKAQKMMKDAQRAAFPDLPDDAITGKISNIEDEVVLKKLKQSLSAIRVAPKKTKKVED